ncbi:hypothetical protein TCAL_11643 [Tigriopus californicus]|uniref:BCL2/adenovirus E1B 19 kDa protein-interacting protein 3 n=1 Tax=Tigriopus californicus TaxID=6832 RepID=A0A553PI17_TIGCA|nr:uncharacterized protein LOC131881181 [Tigriopus californicus]TRY77319.1 hypothetical protein TCAL_11643 [Tigriopus californicus]|eukprot:TCALIF_11643-PA protein Name:"Protein of unknown function" AED:0.06 eAED:0.06 QI:283/1/1/1/0.8/0.66/6/695/218
MSSTPPENVFSDSWVDLSGQFSQSHTPNRVTPIPFGGEQDYLRMLREAQRESKQNSNKVSPISSALMSLSSTTRNTPSASPKSPPNSPNPELATFAEDLKGVYVNRLSEPVSPVGAVGQPVTPSEMLWDWTSRPTAQPRDWKLAPNIRSRKSSSSFTSSGAHSSSAATRDANGKKTTYSKGVIYTLIITNIISMIIGAGIGMWISKRGGNHGFIEIAV